MKKIFSKTILLCSILSCMFLVSACSLSRDKNIMSISIIESTVPEYIVAGQFDNAGIKALITYEDNSTDELRITTSLIPESYRSFLNGPGIHEIEILYRGVSTTLEVRIVEPEIGSMYVVKFFDANGYLISTQLVAGGEDAVLPDERLYNKDGYNLVAWDRDFTNITADTNVYGVFSKANNQISGDIIEQKLFNAERYLVEHDHTMTMLEINEGIYLNYAMINYHYNQELRIGSSQVFRKLIYDESGRMPSLQISYLNADTMIGENYLKEIDDSSQRLHIDYQTIDLNTQIENMGLYETSLMIAGGIKCFVFPTLLRSNLDKELSSVSTSYDYTIYNNREIYIATTELIDVWGERSSVVKFYYDENALLKIEKYYVVDDVFELACSYSINYETKPFEENFIPKFGDANLDETIDYADIIFLNNCINSSSVLTDRQEMASDVNLDGVVNADDITLIEQYINGEIDRLPVVSESEE